MIKITKSVMDDMANHAMWDISKEACGYLGAENGIINTCYRMRNMDDSSEHFSLDPGEQFSVIRDMRESGIKLAAVYHSHPETPARPSEEDIRLAHDPDLSYVIVSLAGGDVTIKSFRIKKGKADSEEIELTDV